MGYYKIKIPDLRFFFHNAAGIKQNNSGNNMPQKKDKAGHLSGILYALYSF